MEGGLPVDVGYDELVAWLSMKQVLPPKWQDDLRRARALAQHALSKTREAGLHGATVGELGEEMDYFSCKEAFGAILAKEEAAGNAGKTLFGNFKSELLHAWSVAVREYEKNNIYLGEAARNMSQFTGYEIPGLQNAVEKSKKEVAAADRKERDIKRSIAARVRSLEEEAARLGLEMGDLSVPAVRHRVLAQLEALPARLRAVDAQLRGSGVADAAAYYRAFAGHGQEQAAVALREELAHGLAVRGDDVGADADAAAKGGKARGKGKGGKARGKGKPPATGAVASSTSSKSAAARRAGVEAAAAAAESFDPASLLPALTALAGREALEERSVEAAVARRVATSGGDGEPVLEGGAAIDWGALAGGADQEDGAAPAAVDWGIGDAGAGDGGEAPPTDAPLSVNWDIGVADGDGAAAGVDWGIGDAGEGAADGEEGSLDLGAAAAQLGIEVGESGELGPADGEDEALAAFTDVDARAHLANDLVELECFLEERKRETESDANVAFASAPLSQPRELRNKGGEWCSRCLAEVRAAREALEAEDLRALLQVLRSDAFVERQVDAVQRKLDNLEKLRENASRVEDQKAQAMRDSAEAWPAMRRLVGRVRELKATLEREVAAKVLKGRRLNIVGKVNALPAV